MKKKSERNKFKNSVLVRTLRRLWEFADSHRFAGIVIGVVAIWVGFSWFVLLAEKDGPQSQITNMADALWWGIVTFLTVGYGDKVPLTGLGRIWAGGLMFSGVAAVGIVTARISSYFLEKTLLERRRFVDTHCLKGHFIVCGWKDEMESLLLHILDCNPGLASDQIVLVASIEAVEIQELRANPRLKGLQVVMGEYFHENYLRKAAPERAKKILLLADQKPNAAGQVPTEMEADARTIMTAMTLSHIARGTLVAAEILDSKMDQYLRLANVNEVIYTREYSRLLLGNASAGTGIANVVFDLLNPKTSSQFRTVPVPGEWAGKSFQVFREHYQKRQPRSSVIGVLENTGNSHRIKEQALREAQKTPDVGKLVENLRSVKQIKFNNPVFNPNPEYRMTHDSMAIVIETIQDEKERGSEGGNTEKLRVS
ncbi:ion channel [Bdellovibrionota bacterium FG-2]